MRKEIKRSKLNYRGPSSFSDFFKESTYYPVIVFPLHMFLGVMIFKNEDFSLKNEIYFKRCIFTFLTHLEYQAIRFVNHFVLY
jgi:hypothetical protein